METHDFLTAEKFLVQRATVRRIPISGVLELTPVCNMNCDMCYVRLSREAMESKGRLRTVSEWLSLAEDMKKSGTIFLLLTGGEPLLYPGFKELYLELRKNGMILTINTNGTMIDEEWADFFAMYQPRRINITLYGANEDTYHRLCHSRGGFQKTIRAIRLLNECGVDVKINGSVAVQNQSDGKSILKIAQELNTYCKVDTYMFPGNRERDDAFDSASRLSPEEAARERIALDCVSMKPEAFKRLAQYRIVQAENQGKPINSSMQCRAGRSSFSINWQGLMQPCIFMKQPVVPVFEYGFSEGWNWLTEQVSKIRLSETCSICSLRSVCQVCAASALLETGSFDGTPEYLCRYTRESLRLMKAYLYQGES